MLTQCWMFRNIKSKFHVSHVYLYNVPKRDPASRRGLSFLANSRKWSLCGKYRTLPPSTMFKQWNSMRMFSKVASQTDAAKRSVKLSKSEFRRLLLLAKPERWKVTGALFLLLISSTVTMAVPFALGKVIDVIYTSEHTVMKEKLNKLALMLVGIFVIGGLCNFGRVYLMSISGHRITRDLRRQVFSHILSQEVAYFDHHSTGELVNRLSSDTTLISQSLTMNISDGLRSTVMVIAGVSMMFYMSPQLATVGLAVVPPVAAMAVVYGRFVRKITKQVQDSLASATNVAQERISNIRTVKAFSNESREISSYNDRLDTVLRLAYKESLARGIFFGLTGLSGNMIVLTVLYYGGVMVGESTLTVGNLSSFLLYAAYIGVSIGGLSSFYTELNKGLGATTRLWEIIDRKPSILNPDSASVLVPVPPRGFINFEKVTFAYPTRKEAPILQDLTLHIPEAGVTAIVGGSGSGKSTIASMLLRLYDPDAGRVSLDGVDLTQLRMEWIRRHIGYVSQEPILFSCSIRENILYGAAEPSSVTEEQLMSAAKESNCWEFISRTFPQGLNTVVGERGVMLSGGQKQRIAIARALIKNPRILLLDEATSALDAESEHLVQEALERIMKDRTVLSIAHRLSTIRNADQIAVLEKGRIVEIGTYEKLMAIENGAFRKLVKHQTFL